MRPSKFFRVNRSFTGTVSGILLVSLVAAGTLILAGAFYFKQNKKPQSVVQTTVQSSPSVTPESTNSADTANWKTYTSKFGYQISYPQNYSLRSFEGTFEASIEYIEGPRTGGGPPNYGFSLTLSEPFGNKENLSAQEYGENYKKESFRNPKPKVQYIKVNGIDAVLTDTGDSPHTLFIPYKDKIYRLDASFSSGKNIDYQTIFDQILSTFKFLN